MSLQDSFNWNPIDGSLSTPETYRWMNSLNVNRRLHHRRKLQLCNRRRRIQHYKNHPALFFEKVFNLGNLKRYHSSTGIAARLSLCLCYRMTFLFQESSSLLGLNFAIIF